MRASSRSLAPFSSPAGPLTLLSRAPSVAGRTLLHRDHDPRNCIQGHGEQSRTMTRVIIHGDELLKKARGVGQYYGFTPFTTMAAERRGARAATPETGMT